MVTKDKEKDYKKPEALQLKAGLYCVATPIGNLGDITLRALDTLRAVDIILCEDSRVTKKLLTYYQIKARLERYNDHSKESDRGRIIDMISSGKSVALVSDAGMPLVSDPGYKLVRQCHEEGIYVTTIPGASACLCAVQLSGLPSDRFSFLGFMPAKSSARISLLQEWVGVKSSLILYETSPRLLASLKDIREVLGNREVAVIREISKLYEEVKRGAVEDLLQQYGETPPKGEIVIVVAPAQDKVFEDDDVETMLIEALNTMKVKQAAAYVAEITGRKKSDLYNMALKLIKG